MYPYTAIYYYILLYLYICVYLYRSLSGVRACASC